MSLPCLLSTDVAHSNRILPVTPFVAFFSASALDFLWWNLEIPFKKRKYLLDLLVFLLLSGITFQNAHTYFVEQAQNENCSRSFGIGQTDIGRTIESLEQKQPGRHRYLISPFYYQNHTVSFLGYSAQNRIFEFHPEDVQFGLLQGNMDIVLFLEEGKEGVFDFLKNLSHQYQETRVKDSQTTILYRLDLPQQRLSWSKGLKGTHVNSLNWKDPPVAVRWDPVLNFTNKKDFPFTNYPPFSIRWEGQLLVPATGPYQLMALTTDMADIKIDGKMVFNKAKGPPPVITLTKGSHRLLIRYQKIRGDSMVFDLLWTKPGQDHLEIVPASAFGKIIQGGK
jgi:hypothetical protein